MDIVTIFEQFPTQESCIEYLEQARWRGVPKCPYCKSTHCAPAQHRHRCYDCKTSFSVTVGTIFHHTHLPLQKWFLAVMLVLNAKKSPSVLQLSRDLHVNKDTAWRIAMQLRKAMTQTEERGLLARIIEIDETGTGSKPREGDRRKPSKSGRGTEKAAVRGANDWSNRVTAKATNDAATLMTDHRSVDNDVDRILPHRIVSQTKWDVEGDSHTNTIDGSSAPLKRGTSVNCTASASGTCSATWTSFSCNYHPRSIDRSHQFALAIDRGLGG